MTFILRTRSYVKQLNITPLHHRGGYDQSKCGIFWLSLNNFSLTWNSGSNIERLNQFLLRCSRFTNREYNICHKIAKCNIFPFILKAHSQV